METKLAKQKFEFYYPNPSLMSDNQDHDPFALLNEMDQILDKGLSEIHEQVHKHREASNIGHILI